MKSPCLLLEGSLGFWESRGWIGVDRSRPDFAARIKVAHYGEALEELLDRINGTQFEVTWQFGRVLTDATDTNDLPIPIGWMLAKYESDAIKPKQKADQQVAEKTAIHNTVTITPVFNNNNSDLTRDGEAINLARSGARAGWTNVLVALLVAAAVIWVTLWVAGKL